MNPKTELDLIVSKKLHMAAEELVLVIRLIESAMRSDGDALQQKKQRITQWLREIADSLDQP